MFTKFIRYTLRVVNVALALVVASVLFGPQAANAATLLIKGKAVEEKERPQNEITHRVLKSAPVNYAYSENTQRLAALLRAKLEQSTAPTTAPVPTSTPTHSVPVPTESAPPTPTPTPTENTPTPTPTSTPSPAPPVSAGRNIKVAAVLAFARAQLGEQYVLGGIGPNTWDCSGLTLASFENAGINIGPHSATAQYDNAANKGYLESYADREAGDLVFYTDGGGDMYHVAIYSGSGMMIEAPDYGKPVREVPVRDTDLVGQVARFIR